MLDPGLILYAGAVGLIVIGIAGIVIGKHLFRILLALVIAEAGANMLLVLAGFRFDAIAPIIQGSSQQMVDPVPQAMVLTAIVIGVSIQALALALIIQVYRHYATLDIRELRHRLEQDVAQANQLGPAHSADEPETVVSNPVSGPASAGTST